MNKTVIKATTNQVESVADIPNITSYQLEKLKQDIAFCSNQVSDLQVKYQEMSIKTQATADFSDDLVTSSSTLLATVEERVSKTLDVTDMVLTNADSLISTYLVIISIVVAVVGTVGSLLIQYRLAKTREAHLQDAVDNLTEKLQKNRDFKEQFIHSLVIHPDLSENINTSIDNAVKERVASLDLVGSTSEDTGFKADLAK